MYINYKYKYKRSYWFHSPITATGKNRIDYDCEKGIRRSLQDEYQLYQEYLNSRFGILTKRNLTTKPY